MRLLVDSEVQNLLSMQEAVAVAERALRAWAVTEDSNRPRQRVYSGNDRLSVHPGGFADENALGVYMHEESLRIDGTQQKTLPYPSVTVVFDTRSRSLAGLIVGRPGLVGSQGPGPLDVINRLRTPAISAVGTRVVSRSSGRVCALFGSGRQAREHLRSHLVVLDDLEEVRVFSPTRSHREKFVADSGELEALQGRAVKIFAVTSPADAVKDADVVVAATNTTEPVFDGKDLKKGAHVVTIDASNIGLMRTGIIAKMRSELDRATLEAADQVVVLHKAQAVQDQQALLMSRDERGVMALDEAVELRDILRGDAKLDDGQQATTIFFNNAGTGIVDVAIAARLVEEARARHVGIEINHEDLISEA